MSAHGADVEEIRLAGGRALHRRGTGPGTAVILPGAGYPPAAPLLWYIRRILQDRGWSALEIWDDPSGAGPEWAEERLAAALAWIGAAPAFVVAKDVACRAAPAALARGLPGIWIGPDLTGERIPQALSGADVPTLVVGTSSDPAWQVATAARIRKAEILQMSEPDPDFEIPGDPDRTLSVLARVLRRVEALVDRVTAPLEI